MSDTQQMIQRLIARIRALAKTLDRSPSTISSAVLKSGAALDALENGNTMTFAKYERAMAKLDEMEREAGKAKAA